MGMNGRVPHGEATVLRICPGAPYQCDAGEVAVPVIDHGNWLPAVEFSETEESLMVSVELPDVQAENIAVSVVDNELSIRGERVEGGVSSGQTFRSLVSFCRSFPMPVKVCGEQATAHFASGVLHITLPKTEMKHGLRTAVSLH